MAASLLDVSAVSTTKKESFDKRAGTSLPRMNAVMRVANCFTTTWAA